MKMGSKGRDKEADDGRQQSTFATQATTREPEMLLNIIFKFSNLIIIVLILL